tara:strand:- start:197 stop:826 length:630 start_codon:yes stop_codon:yes gene_type:complete
MEFIKKLSLLVIIPCLLSLNTNSKLESLKIGADAPLTNHIMKEVSGKEFSLNDLNQKNGLLIIFSCNTCPFVVGNKSMDGWENRYNEVHETCKKNQIGMALINSNEAKRKQGDSFEDMKNHSKKQKYDSPYLLDKNHQLADAFGASTTPHVFLLNNNLKLVYKGAIDDNCGAKKEVKEKWLENALNSLGKGENIENSETRNSGCSIKRI